MLKYLRATEIFTRVSPKVWYLKCPLLKHQIITLCQFSHLQLPTQRHLATDRMGNGWTEASTKQEDMSEWRPILQLLYYSIFLCYDSFWNISTGIQNKCRKTRISILFPQYLICPQNTKGKPNAFCLISIFSLLIW